jgi:hypothetical protein
MAHGTFSVQMTRPAEESHPELEVKRHCSSMTSTGDGNAIDSEILALLVDDSPSENDSRSDSNSECNQKHIADMEILDYFVENEDKKEVFREEDNQQDSGCLDEDWLLDEGETYLSNHLEKMSMIPTVEEFLPSAAMTSSESILLDLDENEDMKQSSLQTSTVSVDSIGSSNFQGLQLENFVDASSSDVNTYWCGTPGSKDLTQREIEMEYNQRNSLEFSSKATSNQITEVSDIF